MRRLFLATLFLCLCSAAALSQDAPFELAEKLNKADRAGAMKMFPGLEKKGLLGVEEERVLLGGELKKLTRFSFHLPLSREAKTLYYCYKLKTGSFGTRLLAAQNLRPYPAFVAATLEELVAAGDINNFDLAVVPLLDFATIGFHEDSPSSFALYWSAEEGIAFVSLSNRLHALLATSLAAAQDELGPTTQTSSELKHYVLRHKAFGKGKDFSGVLKTRIAAAKDETLISDFTLAKAFVDDDLETLLNTLLSEETKAHARELSLQYLEESKSVEVVPKLLGAIGNIKEGALFNSVMDMLVRTASARYNSEEICNLALAIHEKLKDRGETWMRSLLLRNSNRELAQRLYDTAKKQEDKEKRKLYQSLALEVTSNYQAAERRAEGLGDDKEVRPAPRWIHLHQDRNGSWDSDGFQKNCDTREGVACDGKGSSHHDIAASSWALLSFLGSGHTHRVGLFKKTVKRGLDWLVSQQTSVGRLGPATGSASIENHAMGTWAMCEAYAVTRDYRLKGPALNALEFLLSQQGKDGGWKKAGKSPVPNMLTTTWAVLALRSAKISGLQVPQKRFEKTLNFLDSRTTTACKAKAGFMGENRSQAIAGMAIASVFCGRSRRDERFLKLIDFLDNNPPKWNDVGGPVYWYFGTYAMFQHGGEKWERWVKALKRTLLDKQRVGGCADGSWDPVGPDAKKLGRVGTTTLNVLTLEVYYRYARANPSEK